MAAIIVLGAILKVNYERNKTGSPNVEAPAVRGVSEYVGKKLEEGEQTLQEVLGETTSFVAEQASKSASAITSVVLEKSSAKIVEQIDKLPDKEKEEVKKNLCR